VNRIVFLVGTLQTGGIERLVTNWCLYLKANTNWEPAVICLIKRTGPFLGTLEAEHIRVEECRVREAGFVWRLRRMVRALNPKVVHSQVAFSMPWQIMGILLSGSRRVVFTQHNEYQNWKPLLARVRIRLYFLVFFRFIHRYTCVSEKVRQSLCDLVGKSPEQFVVIPNSVNTNIFFPDTLQRKKQRDELGVPPTTFLAGMVARFSPQKGHHYLIEAARVLKERNVGGKFLLVGVGELEADIKAMVSRYGLEDTVIFYGQATEVHCVLQALDCFVLPSLWEGMPLALLEAMASGIPVIATEVAGTREVIHHLQNGLLIPPKNVESIVEAFVQLKNGAQLRNNLAQQALMEVRDKYSVQANVNAYLKLYGG